MSSYNEKHWKTNSLETGFVYINELQWETLKNKFVGNGICVYQWVTMRNMENDKNHTVEHIRWVSYNEKHSVETGILYINELQWETWKMITTAL